MSFQCLDIRMPPPPRAKEALVAMKNIGFSSKVAGPILKKLLEVYENNWEYIEQDGYQVLIDGILEEQEKMVINLCILVFINWT